MKKPVYVCLPYRSSNHENTMVYAGTSDPVTDGDVLRIDYDERGRPSHFELVREEQ